MYYLNCARSNLSVKESHTAMKCASTDRRKESTGIEDMDILEQEIWNELQRNNWFMDLIMNQRKNQVFVNHVLMVSRVHCHFPRQGEKVS